METMAGKFDHNQLDDAPILPEEADRLLSDYSGHEPLALAVSGGSDSVALMTLMADRFAAAGGDAPVTVLSVDHGLRPGSAREAADVGIAARRHGFGHVVLRWQGDKPSRGVQAAARQARYDLMSEWCVAKGVGSLLLAHTLNDVAETFMLRLARGSGVDGLAAMAETVLWNGVALRRPLLDVPRDRLIATLRARRLSYVRDSANVDDRFARARMRKLMPALAAEGAGIRRIADTALRMRRARHALEHGALALSRRAVNLFDAGYCRIDPAGLDGAPDDLVLRVLARVVMALGGNALPPRLAGLERLAGWMAGDTTAGCTLGGCRFERRGRAVTAYRERGRRAVAPLPLKPGETAVWDGRFHVRAATGAGTVHQVRALEARGWRQVRELLPVEPPLPARIGHGLVSFWAGERLVAVPHLGFHDNGRTETATFSARFCNGALMGFSDADAMKTGR